MREPSEVREGRGSEKLPSAPTDRGMRPDSKWNKCKCKYRGEGSVRTRMRWFFSARFSQNGKVKVAITEKRRYRKDLIERKPSETIVFVFFRAVTTEGLFVIYFHIVQVLSIFIFFVRKCFLVPFFHFFQVLEILTCPVFSHLSVKFRKIRNGSCFFSCFSWKKNVEIWNCGGNAIR